MFTSDSKRFSIKFYRRKVWLCGGAPIPTYLPGGFTSYIVFYVIRNAFYKNAVRCFVLIYYVIHFSIEHNFIIFNKAEISIFNFLQIERQGKGYKPVFQIIGMQNYFFLLQMYAVYV